MGKLKENEDVCFYCGKINDIGFLEKIYVKDKLKAFCCRNLMCYYNTKNHFQRKEMKGV